MGILSSSVSITRYQVKGHLKTPILETVANGLKKNAITEIDEDVSEKAVGWTSFHNPFHPDFSGSSFVYGNFFVFSLRIDKKSISPKLFKKHFTVEAAKHLASSGKQFLSRNEKKMLKDHVFDKLSVRIPATPNIYDAIWNYEESCLWFFSNLKVANEELEALFSHSFQLTLLRIFPYSAAFLTMALSGPEKDKLSNLSTSGFTE